MSETGINEQMVCDLLQGNRGDLIMTAEDLGMPPSKLVRYIKALPRLAATYAAIETVKAEDGVEAKSQAAFTKAIQERTSAYRLDGLEVIHDLAMMPHKNANEAEVRLKAAIELRGKNDAGSIAGSAVMEELNALYHQSAPRIKSLRAVQIEFELPTAGAADAPEDPGDGSAPGSTESRTAVALPEA